MLLDQILEIIIHEKYTSLLVSGTGVEPAYPVGRGLLPRDYQVRLPKQYTHFSLITLIVDRLRLHHLWLPLDRTAPAKAC